MPGLAVVQAHAMRQVSAASLAHSDGRGHSQDWERFAPTYARRMDWAGHSTARSEFPDEALAGFHPVPDGPADEERRVCAGPDPGLTAYSSRTRSLNAGPGLGGSEVIIASRRAGSRPSQFRREGAIRLTAGTAGAAKAGLRPPAGQTRMAPADCEHAWERRVNEFPLGDAAVAASHFHRASRPGLSCGIQGADG